MESVTITVINDKVEGALSKFEDEFGFSKVDTMTHRFPAGLGGIRSKYPHYISPRFVAIGPYHHGEEHLQKMEEVKAAAAQYFCELMVTELVPKEAMEAAAFLNAVEEARGKYVGIADGGGRARFAAMMFRDACFLLLYALACSSSRKKKEDGKVNPSLRRFLFANRDSIDRDVMLLENQLPWRVLQALVGLVSPQDGEDLMAAVGSFVQELGSAFKVRESLKREPSHDWVDDLKNNPPPHLLALLRRHKIVKTKETPSIPAASPTKTTTPARAESAADTHEQITTALLPRRPHRQNTDKEEKNPKVTSISAVSPMELEEIGISLRAGRTAAFSDTDFVQGRLLRSELSLPPLSLSDTRASCLVNMAALEVCTASSFRDDPDKTAVCSYLALLAMFMARAEDVRALRSKGLLHGPHSDSDMLAFFKTVSTHLPDSGYRFALVMAKIEEYKRKRRAWMYRWFYNNIMAVIKVLSIIVTVIGFYRAIISLGKHN